MNLLRIFIAGCLLTCFSSPIGFSQNSSAQSEVRVMNKGITVYPRQIERRYSPSLLTKEMPSPGSESYRYYLDSVKNEIVKNVVSPIPSPSAKTASTVPQPIIGSNFRGNSYDFSVPNDNDCAISNDGKIVSVINSTMYVYSTSGTVLFNVDLHDLSDTLGLTASKYDPKVRYDPLSDRFVLVYLSGFTDSTNNIIVAFSQTNDPSLAWNFYSLPGNPLNDTSWTDYPIVALTQNEVFISGNLLRNGGSWQTSFKQSIVWQIRKSDGYSGDSLVTNLWTNVQFGGLPIRNLCPIQEAEANGGPNIFILSNRNFAVTSDTIFIAEITDTIGAAGLTMNIDMRQTSTPYGLAPNGRQKSNYNFATNDSRVFGGFLLGDEIQFVGNCKNFTNNYAGFYHGTVADVNGTKSVTGNIIGDSILDLGYPNISWSGSTAGEKSSIITFDHTSPDSFAGISGIFYDGYSKYSDRLTLKAGENFVNPLSGRDQRWGDYSGTQRKYNQPGVVWMTGFWGDITRKQSTQVIELTAPPYISIDPPQEIVEDFTAWPNPVQDRVSVEFTLEQSAVIDISLLDVSGKLVKTFIHDLVKAGTTEFSFDLNSLSTGTYFLVVTAENKILASKKLFKATDR